VDVVDEVPLERVDALRAEKAIRVFSGPSLRVLFLTLRVTDPPFSDPRVREAVDVALVATKGPGLGVANSGGNSDPVLDGLLAASNEATDSTVRVVSLQKALARVADERPVLPLLLQSEAIAVSRRIDWTPGRGLRIRVEDMRLAQ
jgi:peptide/nickel transport system substrate-binding protein